MDNLAENRTILDQAFLMSPVGMAVLSSEGDRWVMVNPAFCTMLGCSEPEFLAGALSGTGRVRLEEQGDSLYPKS